MDEDKFWMTLHKMGYEIAWEHSSLVIKKDEIPLVIIDRWASNSYTLLKSGEGLIKDEAMLLILSFAKEKIEDRY